jgi:hypothetical protein
LLLTWQLVHAACACAPVKGKPNWLWSNVAASHVFIPWHVSQLVENFEVKWFGMLGPRFAVLWISFAWQE